MGRPFLELAYRHPGRRLPRGVARTAPSEKEENKREFCRRAVESW
jgi:hypothetical protein